MTTMKYFLVWGFLFTLTLFSLFVGTEFNIGSVKLAGAIALAIGFLKVAMVGSVFMGVNKAPLIIKSIFYGWSGLVLTIVCSIYVFR